MLSQPIATSRIEAAYARVDPTFLRSPQYVCPGLSERLALSLVCKVETMNPIGSFKGRGIDWWLQCRPGVRRVVCASAGNLGQALAYAGVRRGVSIDVFVSEHANTRKIAAMKQFGANVRVHGRDFDEAKEAAAQFAAEEQCALLQDGKDAEIAEGLGTIALELETMPRLDAVFVPVGNGALASGVGWWIKQRRPHCRVIGVCAQNAPSMQHSWRAKRVICTASADTVADGIAVRVPVPEALPMLEGAVDDIVLVDEPALRQATRLYFTNARLVAEPAGAAALAAVVANADAYVGRTVAAVLTGSNVDPGFMADALCG